MLNRTEQEDFEYILNDKTVNWEIFSDKTVVVSGANGFLVSYMVKTLLFLNKKFLKNPVTVIGLVRNINKAKIKYKDYLNDSNLILIEHDINNEFHTDKKVDYIIHAASQASPKYFYSDPVGTIKANTIGTFNMLNLAKEKSVSSFLYFSSGEVNGDIFDKLPVVKEEDYGVINPLNVRNCYAESKRMGENMCACWHYQFDVPAKIIRLSHTYGPGVNLDDGRVFASFVKNVLENKNIELNSDGSAKRCFLYLADAARAYFKVLLDGKNGEAYNISNDYEISILDLANIILEVSNKKNLKVCFNIDNNKVSSKVSHALLDNSKIKQLGWMPKIKEAEGFKRVIKSFTEE